MLAGCGETVSQNCLWSRRDGSEKHRGMGGQTDAEGPTEGRNFISPFIVPIRKSNMAMSTMLSSRLPLL